MRALLLISALAAALQLQAKGPDLTEGHEEFFESAVLDRGVVNAKPSEKFEALGNYQKDQEIKKLMLDLDQRLETLEGPLLFRLDQGLGGSLWSLPEGGKAPMLLESWDKSLSLAAPDGKAGKWFTYVGVGFVFSMPSDMNSMSLGGNYGIKIGSFLWKDFLDMGVNYNGGANLNFSSYSTDTSLNQTIGLFSRVHFPILGPFGGNVGAEGAYNSSSLSSYRYASYGTKSSSSESSSSSSEVALLGGLSLFLPSGSIDFDARLSNKAAPVYNIGLTTFIGGPAAPKVIAEKTPKAKKTAVPTRTKTPRPEKATVTPTATQTAKRAATELPTQPPAPTFTVPPTSTHTPEPTSTPVPTAIPTKAPTAEPTREATPDPEIKAEKERLEKERRKLEEDKEELERERALLKKKKAEVRKEASDGKEPFNPEWQFRLGSGYYEFETRAQMQSLADSRNQSAGGSNPEKQFPYAPNFELGLAWRGIHLGWQQAMYREEFQARVPVWQASTSGPTTDASASLNMSLFSVGYDLALHRPFGALGPCQFYLPLRLEFGFHNVELQGNPDQRNYSAQSLGGSAGLGFRTFAAKNFLIDLQVRAHFGEQSEFVEDQGGSLAMSPGGGSGNSGSLAANSSGFEASLGIGLALW